MGTGPDALSFEPLTPVSFLDRAAAAHGDRTAVVDGHRRLTCSELHERCRRPAGALAVLAGGVRSRCWRRTRPCCWRRTSGCRGREHSQAAVLVHDPAFDALVADAVDGLADPPVLVWAGERYEELLAAATPQAVTPDDERALLSINHTSGTTGRPEA